MSKPTDIEIAENTLICEKLLGWVRQEHGNHVWWNPPSINGAFSNSRFSIPAFTNWCEVGEIMDAFARDNIAFDLYQDGKWDVVFYNKYKAIGMKASDTGPLAIRTAALEFIRNQQ